MDPADLELLKLAKKQLDEQYRLSQDAMALAQKMKDFSEMVVKSHDRAVLLLKRLRDHPFDEGLCDEVDDFLRSKP